MASSIGAPLLLDVTRLVRRLWQRIPATGVDRVGLAYVERYDAKARALLRLGPFWFMLTPSDSRVVFARLRQWQPISRWWVLAALARSLAARVTPPVWLLNVVHSGTESPHYRYQVRRHRLKPVYLLHDLIPITNPEHCRRGEHRRHQRRVRTMLDSGRLVVTNSVETARSLVHYATANRLNMPPLVAAPIGLTPLPSVSHRPISTPYFVVVSTVEARKNHQLLLDVWSTLIEKHGEKTPTLVVIGRRGWSAEAALRRMDQCTHLKPHIRVLHACDDQTMATYLTHAEALLYPSLVEGWGLPLAEALSVGVSVLASDLRVFREVAGDVPEYLNPMDPSAWLRAIEAYWRHDPIRAAQSRRRAAWVAVSWDSHFERVERHLKSLDGYEDRAHSPLGCTDAA